MIRFTGAAALAASIILTGCSGEDREWIASRAMNCAATAETAAETLGPGEHFAELAERYRERGREVYGGSDSEYRSALAGLVDFARDRSRFDDEESFEEDLTQKLSQCSTDADRIF